MRKLCLIGDPAEHSLSPAMHNAAIRYLGIQDMFVFEKRKVAQGELANFMRAVSGEEYAGLGVTMPHKAAIIPFLDVVSEDAQLAGAVNTVLCKPGSLEGHNTDGAGCLNALGGSGITIHGRSVVMLGAGGAARAAAITLAKSGIGEIHVINRTHAAAKVLAKILERITDAEVRSGSLASLKGALADDAILINATPVGMPGIHPKSLVPGELMAPGMAVLDMVYHPEETELLRLARNAGARTVPGTEMLLHQGAAQFKLFTGRDAPLDVMREVIGRPEH